MLKVDFRRMRKSKLFYILIACALVIPILITVMTTMMDGMGIMSMCNINMMFMLVFGRRSDVFFWTWGNQ